MTVMELAPAERAGMASATMNALRQTGMSMGIAVLGSMMSVGALHRMTAAMLVAGSAQADTLARQAVMEHVFAQGSRCSARVSGRDGARVFDRGFVFRNP